MRGGVVALEVKHGHRSGKSVVWWGKTGEEEEGDVGCVGLEINSGLSRSIRALFTLHRGPAGLRKVLPCLFHRTSIRDFGLNAFTT